MESSITLLSKNTTFHYRLVFMITILVLKVGSVTCIGQQFRHSSATRLCLLGAHLTLRTKDFNAEMKSIVECGIVGKEVD